MTIYKYPLVVMDEQTIDLPRGSVVLTVQAQHNAPQLWALVLPDEPTEPHHFSTRATGQGLAQEGLGSYLGTYQLDDGAFVGHVFERAA